MAGISGPKAALSAMAVGLVIDVWRNGPVEDMHSATRGPSDAGMLAESTSLHDQAAKALTVEDRPIGLLDFEDYLLDRGRPWAGTGGKTLKDLGYGFLGQYRRLPRVMKSTGQAHAARAARPRAAGLERGSSCRGLDPTGPSLSAFGEGACVVGRAR